MLSALRLRAALHDATARAPGARDHTCPWFYGPEAEKIIEDVIKLRHAMKPYYTAELDKLNETGRCARSAIRRCV